MLELSPPLLRARVDDVRIVSVPADHPYPRAIRPPVESRLVVLADPDPDRPERPAAGRWWPHRGLEPSWLAGQDFDLLHVHFGFDHRSPAELTDLVTFLRDRGRPLVLTVHDLRNPHQTDPTTLYDQLDVLVPAADALLTLTPWAADRIRERWGRTATVVAHPPLVPSETSRRLRERRRDRRAEREQTPVVGLACKSLRPNCDPVRLLPALEDAVARHGARLRVLVHTEVLAQPDSGARRQAAEALAGARARGAEVVAHDPLSDDDLWAELADQDVAVLPYRFGSHSGWLEACHDVGTHVAAPGFGGYADQGADGIYLADDDAVDHASVVRCVGDLLDRVRRGDLAGDTADTQIARRRAATVLHERVYRSVSPR